MEWASAGSGHSDNPRAPCPRPVDKVRLIALRHYHAEIGLFLLIASLQKRALISPRDSNVFHRAISAGMGSAVRAPPGSRGMPNRNSAMQTSRGQALRVALQRDNLQRTVSKTFFEARSGHHDMRVVSAFAYLAQWCMLILCWSLIVLMPYARLDGSMYVIEWVPISLATAFVSMMTLRDLRAQRWFQFRWPRLWLVPFLILGLAVAALRAVSMAMEDQYSEELTMRYVSGIPLFLSKFFGMDLMGYVLGSVCFWLFLTFGMLACCFGNCCGKTATVRRLVKIITNSPPIMDMVQDRQQIKSFSVIAFVLPFTLVFSLVIGGQILTPPHHVFRSAGSPARLVPLCSPPLSSYVREQAARLSQSALGFAERSSNSTGTNPLFSAAGAIGRGIFELAWSSHFEVEHLACAVPGDADRALFAVRLPDASVTSTLVLPNITLALRDTEGLASSIPEDGDVQVSTRLVRAPAACDPGTRLLPAGGLADNGTYHVSRAGVVTLSGLTLLGGPESGAAVPLCPGEHTIEVRSVASRADGAAASPLASSVVARVVVRLVGFDATATSRVETTQPMVMTAHAHKRCLSCARCTLCSPCAVCYMTCNLRTC